MAPQFVDTNADGKLDIVAATFDGSPHIAFGSDSGYAEPKHILDASGKRILFEQFWNYESEKWDKSAGQPQEHCTSAVAFDWDADGDLDLLLGSYGDGNLYLQMNEGTPTTAKYTGKSVPVHAAGKPFQVPGGITTARLVDWDRDGLTDLVVGGYQDKEQGYGGGVWMYRNVGKKGAPSFASGQVLVEPNRTESDGPTRPNSGLYPEVLDYDGDGDLDLIVGGFAEWTPEGRPLSDEEKARVEELQASVAETGKRMNKMYETAFGDLDNSDEEAMDAAWQKLQASEEFQEVMAAMEKDHAELGELVPSRKRESYVWYYERLSGRTETL